MKNEMQSKLALFVENARIIKSAFRWHDGSAKRLAAMVYALHGRQIDCAAIQSSHGIIKSNASVFSTFRGNMVLGIAAMLSLEENRERVFANTTAVYEMMKNAKFRASDYLAVAAFEIASQGETADFYSVVTRAKAFFDNMKSASWFRVGEDDYIYAALLGLSDLDVKAGTEKIAALYQRFKSQFRSKNCVQALSQVLVLSGDHDRAADRVLAIRDALKNRKLRLDKAYTLPLIGVLAPLPIDAETLAHEIDEAYTFLRTQKGFGPWSAYKHEVLLFAATTVAAAYAEDIMNGVLTASVSTSITSIIIAQQIAIMTAMIASTTSASAAATSK